MKKYIAIILILAVSICYAGTFRWQIKLENSDGTDFNSNDSAGASVRLYHSDVTGTTGNLDQTLIEVGNGLWYADIDVDSDGWYEVKTYTDATGSWESAGGFDPVWIGTKEYLPLDGSESMTGSLDLGGNAIDNVYGITLEDTLSLIRFGTINVAGHNLLDKSTNEDITGIFDFKTDFKIDDITVTANATQINMLSNLNEDDDVVTIQDGISRNTKTIVTSSTTLESSDAGYIPIDTSGNPVTIVLPDLSVTGVGAPFHLWMTSGTNAATIIPNAADAGFSLITGSGTQTVGGSLILGSSGSEVILHAGGGSGSSNGYWLILAGQKANIQ